MNQPNLGPCCACERTGNDVRNIMMVHKKSPILGRGWGCFQCGLPQDGACYVLCDNCADKKAKPKFACKGWPGSDGRIPYEQLTGEHNHDMTKHPEREEQVVTSLWGSKIPCERCSCCDARLTACEECNGEGEILVAGVMPIPCPSCEGEGGYPVCEGSCDAKGDHVKQ